MKKKIIAIMPIKLVNERLPGKNTMLLGEKPLLQYELESIKETGLVEQIFVYCSSKDVLPYLPSEVIFVKRPEYLDLPTSNFTQIFDEFSRSYDADIYVYAHATAPFISVKTIMECIQAVKSGEYDSAFCAVKIQDYLWQNGKPMNFEADNIPRSQDLVPIYRETSGVYVFTKNVFREYHRRVGIKPFVKTVTYKEAVDINEPEDFDLAKTLLKAEL